MKKIGIFIMFAAMLLQGFSQEIRSEEKQKGAVKSDTTSTEQTKIAIGDNILSVKEDDNSLSIRIGNRGIDILESLEGAPKVRFEKYTEPEYEEEDSFIQDEDEMDERRSRNRNRFKGHWSGFEFGFNNYLTSSNSVVMPNDIYYMTLHSSKSNNFNFNISQKSLGITKHFGVVTGLGLNWNNYRFDGNNNITKGTNGVIEEFDPGATLEKSKLTSLYLTVPLLIELQIPADNNHINLAAGGIGAIKLGSHSKMVFENDDKVKTRDDFSMNLLRYGATARVGFENFQIYGTYYFTPLFKQGKGPGGYDLYPFEVGFAFSFND